MITRTALTVFVMLFPTISPAWEVIVEREPDGRVFTVAEQIGDAGAFLNVVCFEQKIYLEVIYPAGIPSVDDTVELFQVDGRPEHLIAGYIDQIDGSTSVFAGVDRRDEPAAATSNLLREIMAGQSLYLGDPDRAEAVERWSLAGSSRAIRSVQDQRS